MLPCSSFANENLSSYDPKPAGSNSGHASISQKKPNFQKSNRIFQSVPVPYQYRHSSQNTCVQHSVYTCVHSCACENPSERVRAEWINNTLYCTYDRQKITDVGTFSFRWILPFWYFCFLFVNKASLALFTNRKQKYQNGNIHRKLRVPTSVSFC